MPLIDSKVLDDNYVAINVDYSQDTDVDFHYPKIEVEEEIALCKIKGQNPEVRFIWNECYIDKGDIVEFLYSNNLICHKKTCRRHLSFTNVLSYSMLIMINNYSNKEIKQTYLLRPSDDTHFSYLKYFSFYEFEGENVKKLIYNYVENILGFCRCVVEKDLLLDPYRERIKNIAEKDVMYYVNDPNDLIQQIEHIFEYYISQLSVYKHSLETHDGIGVSTTKLTPVFYKIQEVTNELSYFSNKIVSYKADD